MNMFNIQAIEDESYTTTDMGDLTSVLTYIKDNVLTETCGSRPASTKIVILLTDGRIKDGEKLDYTC